jgi:flagellar biosynthesis component FlhA
MDAQAVRPGDVKAAIMLLINMVGGFFIGVFQKGMPGWTRAHTC